MYYTIGGFTLDDTVLPNGEIQWAAPGGNALYSAVGAKIWGVPVGIITPVGEDYPQAYLDELEGYGFDLSGVWRVPFPSFHVWILHETQTRRQIIYRLDSGTNEHLDPKPTYLPKTIDKAKGVHICPILGSSQALLMKHLIDLKISTFLDLIVIPDQIDVKTGHQIKLWQHLTAFLPSFEEVRALCGPQKLVDAIRELKQLCPPTFAIKLGDQGCLVHEPKDGQIYHIPAYPAKVIDSTGAGDAFCGGFMVGLQETGSAVTAALQGSISASFVIEGFGALHALKVKQNDAQQRMENLRPYVQQLDESALNNLKLGR